MFSDSTGPTQENIDPVRYVGNRSSGKMGLEISYCCKLEKGLKVNLVMGPSNLKSNHPNINQINIVSNDEMYKKVDSIFPNSDISVFSAAVSDYKPTIYHNQKVKKSEDIWNISFKKNIDILKEMSKKRKIHN